MTSLARILTGPPGPVRIQQLAGGPSCPCFRLAETPISAGQDLGHADVCSHFNPLCIDPLVEPFLQMHSFLEGKNVQFIGYACRAPNLDIMQETTQKHLQL